MFIAILIASFSVSSSYHLVTHLLSFSGINPYTNPNAFLKKKKKTEKKQTQ